MLLQKILNFQKNVNFDEAMRRQTLYKTEEGRKMLEMTEGDTHHGGCGNC